jgi:hypothetical protein
MPSTIPGKNAAAASENEAETKTIDKTSKSVGSAGFGDSIISFRRGFNNERDF